jgi:Cu+-exporting ATPase
MAIDPVCGMEVEERTTQNKSTYLGQTYFFCSTDCKEEFDAEPEEDVGEERKTGT